MAKYHYSFNIFKNKPISNQIMNKKGFSLIVVTMILALIILIGIIVNLSLRECNSNRDCSDNAYCDSKHECKAYPDKLLVKENNFLSAALVLGVALMVSAYIFNRNKPSSSTKTHPEKKSFPEN